MGTTTINFLRKAYNLPSDEKVKELSYNKWKSHVKTIVNEMAHCQLLTVCKSMKKTSQISFTKKFVVQPYLISYTTKIAVTIFKVRTQSTNCLANRGKRDALCRLCKQDLEDQEHVLNCSKLRGDGRWLKLELVQAEVPTDNKEVALIAKRFISFQDEIDANGEQMALN